MLRKSVAYTPIPHRRRRRGTGYGTSESVLSSISEGNLPDSEAEVQVILAWLSFAFLLPIPLYPYAPSYPKGVRVAEGEGVIAEGEGVRQSEGDHPYAPEPNQVKP